MLVHVVKDDRVETRGAELADSFANQRVMRRERILILKQKPPDSTIEGLSSSDLGQVNEGKKGYLGHDKKRSAGP